MVRITKDRCVQCMKSDEISLSECYQCMLSRACWEYGLKSPSTGKVDLPLATIIIKRFVQGIPTECMPYTSQRGQPAPLAFATAHKKAGTAAGAARRATAAWAKARLSPMSALRTLSGNARRVMETALYEARAGVSRVPDAPGDAVLLEYLETVCGGQLHAFAQEMWDYSPMYRSVGRCFVALCPLLYNVVLLADVSLPGPDAGPGWNEWDNHRVDLLYATAIVITIVREMLLPPLLLTNSAPLVIPLQWDAAVPKYGENFSVGGLVAELLSSNESRRDLQEFIIMQVVPEMEIQIDGWRNPGNHLERALQTDFPRYEHRLSKLVKKNMPTTYKWLHHINYEERFEAGVRKCGASIDRAARKSRSAVPKTHALVFLYLCAFWMERYARIPNWITAHVSLSSAAFRGVYRMHRYPVIGVACAGVWAVADTHQTVHYGDIFSVMRIYADTIDRSFGGRIDNMSIRGFLDFQGGVAVPSPVERRKKRTALNSNGGDDG